MPNLYSANGKLCSKEEYDQFRSPKPVKKATKAAKAAKEEKKTGGEENA